MQADDLLLIYQIEFRINCSYTKFIDWTGLQTMTFLISDFKTMGLSSYLLVLLICTSYQTSGKELHPNLTTRSRPNKGQSDTTDVPTSKCLR